MFEAARLIQDQVPTVRFWMLLSMERYRQMIEVAIQQSGLRTGLEAADLALTKAGTTSLT